MAEVLELVRSVWTPWIDVAVVAAVLSGMLLWAMRTAEREKARYGGNRPGQMSHTSDEGMDMYTLHDSEGEALPPPCPACGGARGTPVEPCDLCQGAGR